MKKLLPILLLAFSIHGYSQRLNLITEVTSETPQTLTSMFDHLEKAKAVRPYSIMISDSNVLAGTKALRFQLYKGDGVATSGSYRTEGVFAPEGAVIKERWYGWAFYLVNWVTDPMPEIIKQWHSQNGCNCQPPIDFTIQNGRFLFHTSSITTSPPSNANEVNTTKDLGAAPTGRWVKMVMHVKWDYRPLNAGGSGLIEVWQDGVKVVSQTGPNEFNESTPVYEKSGIYKYGWDSTNFFYTTYISQSLETNRLMLMDEIRVGNENATYNDVVPGSPTITNINPVAHAGIDQTITLPTSSVTLSGSGTDADGHITAYRWSKLSGPVSGTLIRPDSAIATFNTIKLQGTYVFSLVVTDDSGGHSNPDTIAIIVNPSVVLGNQNPVASAGIDQDLVTGIDSATLNGSGSSDPDGSISTYAWTQLSGGPNTVTITSAASAITKIHGLIDGEYDFQLTVTDNLGATASDVVHVSVGVKKNPSPSPVPPVGSNSLLINSVTAVRGKLNITATGPTGNIKFTLMSANGSLITYINDKKKTATQSFSYSYSTFYFPAKRTYSLKATVGNNISKTVSFTTK